MAELKKLTFLFAAIILFSCAFSFPASMSSPCSAATRMTTEEALIAWKNKLEAKLPPLARRIEAQATAKLTALGRATNDLAYTMNWAGAFECNVFVKGRKYRVEMTWGEFFKSVSLYDGVREGSFYYDLIQGSTSESTRAPMQYDKQIKAMPNVMPVICSSLFDVAGLWDASSSYAGPVTVSSDMLNGKPCYVVELGPDKLGIKHAKETGGTYSGSTKWWIDKSNLIVLQKRFYSRMKDPGENPRTSTSFERDVDVVNYSGWLVPTRRELTDNEDKKMVLFAVTKFDVNQGVDASLFDFAQTKKMMDEESKDSQQKLARAVGNAVVKGAEQGVQDEVKDRTKDLMQNFFH